MKKYKWDDPRDATWYSLFLLYMLTVIWVLIGIYKHNWELFKVICWPMY